MIYALIIIVSSIFLSWFYSGTEAGGYAINRIRLHHQATQGSVRAARLEKMLQNPQRFVFSALVGNNIALYLVSQTMTKLYFENGVGSGDSFAPFWNAEMAATLTLTPTLFIFAEVFPKNLFRKCAFKIMLQCTYGVQISMWLFEPITKPLRAFFRVLIREQNSEDVESTFLLSPQRVRMFFSQSVDEGSMSLHQNSMMENVIAMRNVNVTQIMTPISDIPSISPHATVKDLKEVLRKNKHSRAVVFHSNSKRVSGTVHLFDVINASAKDSDHISKYMQRAVHLKGCVSVQEAFAKLRDNKHPVAFVGTSKQSFGQIRLNDIAQYVSRRA